MERSEIRGGATAATGFPDCAALHPGYESPPYFCGPDSEISRSARKTLL
jgi:hypothetical protein